MNRSLSLPALQIALALTLLVPVGPAVATTFSVTNLVDAGLGSLRQAVLDANAAAGADEVTFAPGLTGTITLTSGEIVISDSLVIHGPGLGALTVSGGDQYRIFFIENPTVTPPIDVTLTRLTLSHGRGSPAHSGRIGGAVFANGENLTIQNSVISNSRAGSEEGSPTFECGGNVALFGSGGQTLRVEDSLLTGGVVGGLGDPAGGNLCILGGRLVLERSVLSGGSAWHGGGLFADSLAANSSIFLSKISENDAAALGGGIACANSTSSGDLTIEASTITGNSVPRPNGSGGGISTRRDNLLILASTISGNSGDAGGGIISDGSDLRMINSTVSGNDSRLGGGLYFAATNSGGTLLLLLTTVSNNTASQRGGSLLLETPPMTSFAQLDHSVVANGVPEDLAGPAMTLATLSANHSLIEAPGTTLVSGADNQIGADPLLGPLANHGGPTLTHMPLPGSPVLDAGDPALVNPPATDQRGAVRIVGPAIDLGSVEAEVALVEVPTLSQVGLLVLCALLLGAGILRLRRAGVTGQTS
ncbi:MAG TPA: IPTL-CTERM sorting domain-containing protein [Thermoanaerobaculia bacterium]|jgi:hypothetical protein|nr:IPTL-CTERM sorting domain-containing protein [Thermoanaerobaculia bacterium]